MAHAISRSPADRHSWLIDLDASRIPIVRRDVAAWLTARGVPEVVSTDLTIVVSELVSNAVRAARTTVTVEVGCDHDLITLEVRDDGQGATDLDRFCRTRPDPLAEAGRGLFIVRELADQVTIDSSSDGSIVRAVRSLTAQR